MSNEIDQRIVEMQFDNKQFERGVKTTVDSLNKLKEGLNLDESAKSLSNLQKVGDKFSLAHIASGVEQIASRFTNLGIVGVTALQNITNSAIYAGKRMVKALTLDPVMQGFNEYETKMNAITTILTNTKSKGTTLDDVNAALGELNTYADKTIYNFAEMTRNIGTFTAAGVDLETSVASIKGIANLAAGSGSNAQQASMAMYQLSQALAAGVVKLQDWNSVVNAGMGGELFQNALKESAKELGIFVDESVPFRESLQDGWLTTEVLTKTLNKFAEDESLVKAATQVKTFTQLFDTMKESVQSGWAQSWEYIVGDSQQAAQMLTNISDAFNEMIGPSTEARNAMLKFWNENGGRDAVITGLSNAFQTLGDVIKPIKEAFREVFPPMTGEMLVEISNRFRELTEQFKIGESTAAKIKDTFKGLFSIINIVKNAFTGLLSAVGKVIGVFLPAGEGILSFTAAIGSLLTKLDETIEGAGIFETVFGGIANAITTAVKGISTAINWIAASFTGMTDKIDTGWFASFAKIADTISNAFRKMGEVVKNAMSNLGFDSVLDVVNGGLLAAILVGVKKFIGSLTDVVKSGNLLESLTGLLDGVKGSLEAWQSSLKANTLLKIAGAVGILAASLLLLSTIEPAQLTASLAAMTGLFIELFASMAVFEKLMGGAGFQSIRKITTSMLGLSTAVLVLSFAMKNLAGLNWNEIAVGLAGLGGMMAEMVAVSVVLEKTSAKMVKGSAGLVLFSTAMLVLAQAVKQLSTLSWGQLAVGLAGVGALLAEISVFMKLTDFSGIGVAKAAGILVLAEALQVLSGAVSSFASLNVGQLIQGLTAIGVVLTELGLFVNLTGNAQGVLATAAGLTVLGVAMKILASATADFGSIPLTELGTGLLGMAGALAVVTAAMRVLPKNMMAKSVALVGIASALVILSQSLENMGGMGWDEIAKGLVALAGSMGVIVAAMKLMTTALPGAAALLVVSASLLALTPVLLALGGMSWDSIIKGIVALAGAFTVFGVAALALTPVLPAMLGLAGAVALLGTGFLAAGAGVLALGAGLTALAAAFAASGGAIYSVVENLLNMIPLLFQKIGEGIVSLAGVIANGAPAIGNAFVALIGAAVDAIVTATPKIVEGIFVLLDAVLAALVTYVPKFVDYLFKMFIEVINVLAQRMPELIAAGANLLMSFVNGVLDALGQLDGESLQGIITALGSMIVIFTMITALGAVMTTAAVAMTAMAGVLAILGGLAQIPGLTWLVNEGGKFLGAVGAAIGSFVGGLVGGFAEIASGALPAIGTNLAEFMNNAKPFFDGVKGVDESASKGVAALAGAILALTASNILEGLTSWFTGGSSLVTFGKELAEFAPYFKAYADNVAGIDGTVVQASANAALALAEMAGKLPNSGGVAGWFAGENSLAVFAQELTEFGPALKAYADSVAGLDSDVVVNSANAASALSEMANNLPNQGGVAGWIAGENSLSIFAEELSAFGPKLKSYADSVSGLNGDVVVNSANAAKALSELATNLPNQGGMLSWFTGDNDIGTFGQNLVLFGQSLKNYYDTVSGINPALLNGVVDSVWGLVDIAKGVQDVNLSGMASFGMALQQMGSIGIRGFISAFTNAASEIQAVGETIVSNALKGVESKQAGFVTAGANAAKGFAKGMDANRFLVTRAGRQLGKDALDAARAELEIESPSKVMRDEVGRYIVEGIAEGITKDMSAEQAAEKKAQNIVSAFQAELDKLDVTGKTAELQSQLWEAQFGSAASDAELSGNQLALTVDKLGKQQKRLELAEAEYQQMVETFGESSEEAQESKNKSLEEQIKLIELSNTLHEITQQNELDRVKADTETHETNINMLEKELSLLEARGDATVAEKTTGKIDSLNWQLSEQTSIVNKLGDEYQHVVEIYGNSSEEAKEALGNWMDAQQQWLNLEKEIKDASYDNSMDWIEEEKYYGRMSLADELAAYTRVQQRYKKGTEERKKLDREVYRLTKEIYEAQMQYEDDVAKAKEESTAKRKELEQDYADKVKEINDQLADDIKQLDDEYANSLKSRTQSLYDAYGLFDEVTKKDPVSADTLMKNLRDQVETFEDWQKQLDSLSARGLNDALIDELEEMGPSAIAEIKALNSMSDAELAQYAALWAKKHREAKEQATKELEGLRIETQSQIAVLKEQAAIELDGLEATFHENLEDLNADTDKQLQDLRDNFEKQVGILKTNTEQEFQEMSDSVQNIMRQAGWNELGQNIVNGLIEGIESKKPDYILELERLANAGDEAMRRMLDLHSPSRVFAEIGRFMVEGLVVGIKQYSKKVADTTADVGHDALNALGSTISGIGSLLNGNIDAAPTIRPVLDFSNVTRGIRYIDGQIAASRSMQLGMSVGYSSQNGNEAMKRMADVTVESNAKMASAIASLEAKMDKMVEKIAQMQVVMDTGSLVGAISPEVDRSLGRIAAMNRRGV